MADVEAVLFAPMKEHGFALLKHDPEFVFDRIGIVTPQGEGVIKGVLRLKGMGEADFATGSMAWLNKLEADFTIECAQKLIEKFPNGATGAGVMVDQGFAKREGDKLVSHIEYKKGELKVNGKAQAIPGLRRATARPDGTRTDGAGVESGLRIAMSSLKNIPVVTESRAPRSGEKYVTPQGFTAIKDGQKPRAAESPSARVGKPRWIMAPLAAGAGFSAVKNIVREHRLATVCEEAKCPNIGECWNAGTATIMLMGAVCTRACRFCSVDTGNPRGWLDEEEPENTARSVELMKLKYIVLTSVNRDDLPDGGAAHYAAAIRAIKRRTPEVAVEALTPDFQGVLRDVEIVLDSGLEVFAQNVETVKRLTHPVRDPRAGYEQTIAVLAHAKQYKPRCSPRPA